MPVKPLVRTARTLPKILEPAEVDELLVVALRVELVGFVQIGSSWRMGGTR